MSVARGRAGFSILEAMVALGIASFLVVAAFESVAVFSKTAPRLQRRYFADVDSQLFSNFAISLLSEIDVSRLYQNLPIPSTCVNSSSNEPCLRTVDATQRFVNVTAAPAGIPTFLQFFSDRPGSLSVAPAYAADPGAVVQGTEESDLDFSTSQTGYYVTWKLVDETSPALLMLRRAPYVNDFVFDWGAQVTNTPPADRHITFAASVPSETNSSLSALQGSLMLLANQNSLQEYMIGIAADIRASGLGRFDIDLEPANSAASSFSSARGVFPSAGDLSAIWRGPFSVDLYWGGNNTSYRSIQSAGFYPFSTELFSLSSTWVDGGGVSPFSFNPGGVGVDFRKVAYYYQTALGITPTFTLQALTVDTLFLQPGTPPPDCPSNYVNPPPGCPSGPFYKLVTRSFPSGATRTLVEQLPSGASVVFARRLGTPSVLVAVQ